MVRYRVRVHTYTNEILGEFTNIRRLQFGKRLNNYGSLEIDIPENDPQAINLISLRRYNVFVYRDGAVGPGDGSALVWGGEQASRRGNLTSDGTGVITLYCFGFLERLAHKFTDQLETYTDEDAGQIANQLHDNWYGIETGVIEPTVNRDRTYKNDNVLESLINLSNVINGFDFELTDLNTFNVYASQGIDRTDSVVLEWGRNIESATIEEDFSRVVTKAIVVGQDEDGNVLRYDEDDPVLIELYNTREGLRTEFNISEQQTFIDKAQAMIRKYGTPLMKLDLNLSRAQTPSIEDFALGDRITVKINNGVYDIDETYRIFEWTLRFMPDNTEHIELVLGKFTLEDEE